MMPGIITLLLFETENLPRILESAGRVLQPLRIFPLEGVHLLRTPTASTAAR